jgi:hypothetical protein
MSVTEAITAEEFAQLFHHYHEVVARCFSGGDTLPNTWLEVEPRERRVLVATARLVLDDIASKQHAAESAQSADDSLSNSASTVSSADRRRYFAKPGQAEWGC